MEAHHSQKLPCSRSTLRVPLFLPFRYCIEYSAACSLVSPWFYQDIAFFVNISQNLRITCCVLSACFLYSKGLPQRWHSLWCGQTPAAAILFTVNQSLLMRMRLVFHFLSSFGMPLCFVTMTFLSCLFIH